MSPGTDRVGGLPFSWGHGGPSSSVAGAASSFVSLPSLQKRGEGKPLTFMCFD